MSNPTERVLCLVGPATHGGRAVTLRVQVLEGSPEHERFVKLGYSVADQWPTVEGDSQ